MHFVQHGLREFLTRPRDYSPVVAKHLLFDPDGLLATSALLVRNPCERHFRFPEADLNEAAGAFVQVWFAETSRYIFGWTRLGEQKAEEM